MPRSSTSKLIHRGSVFCWKPISVAAIPNSLPARSSASSAYPDPKLLAARPGPLLQGRDWPALEVPGCVESCPARSFLAFRKTGSPIRDSFPPSSRQLGWSLRRVIQVTQEYAGTCNKSGRLPTSWDFWLLRSRTQDRGSTIRVTGKGFLIHHQPSAS